MVFQSAVYSLPRKSPEHSTTWLEYRDEWFAADISRLPLEPWVSDVSACTEPRGHVFCLLLPFPQPAWKAINQRAGRVCIDVKPSM